MSSLNGKLSIRGYGEYDIRCIAINHGVEIRSTEGESRTSKAFYAQKHSPGSFDIEIVLLSYKELTKFNAWFQGYLDRVADPNRVSNPCKVTVASRGFIKWGLPISGVEHGDQVGAYFYPRMITFEGISDGALETPHISKFFAPNSTNTDANIKYFYPAGVQLSAGQQTEETLFNDDESPQKSKPRTGSSSWGGFRRSWGGK